jgi:hypothetical protein
MNSNKFFRRHLPRSATIVAAPSTTRADIVAALHGGAGAAILCNNLIFALLSISEHLHVDANVPHSKREQCPMPSSPPLSESEFEAILSAAGFDIPDDLKPGVFAGAQQLHAIVETLRQPRTAADEPSNIFSLVRSL